MGATGRRYQFRRTAAPSAPWFGTFFWVIGTVSLFAAALGILDHVGRLVGDILKVTYLAGSRFWTESKIHFAVVWGEILVGTTILLAGLDAPLVLPLIARSINGLVMILYCALLIKLNRSVLPPGEDGGRAPASWSGLCCSTASTRARWCSARCRVSSEAERKALRLADHHPGCRGVQFVRRGARDEWAATGSRRCSRRAESPSEGQIAYASARGPSTYSSLSLRLGRASKQTKPLRYATVDRRDAHRRAYDTSKGRVLLSFQCLLPSGRADR